MRATILATLLVGCGAARPSASDAPLDPPVVVVYPSPLHDVPVAFEDWFKPVSFPGEVALCLSEVDAADVPPGFSVQIDPPKQYFAPAGVLVAGRVDFEARVIHAGYDSRATPRLPALEGEVANARAGRETGTLPPWFFGK